MSDPLPPHDPNPYEASPEGSSANHELNPEARNWAMFCHLAGLAKYTAIPFANILGPLIFWQLKKDEFPFVDHQGKEALNFQISLTIYILCAVPLCCVVVGIPLVAALGLADVVFITLSAIKASKGEPYRYPLTIRFIK